MKRCSLITMKTQIKTTMRYHFTSTWWQESKRQTKIVLGQEVEKLESSHIVGMNVKWYSCFGKQFGTELSRDSIISLLGIYLRQLEHTFTQKLAHPRSGKIFHKSQKVETGQMFNNKWINKLWYIYPYKYCSHKKEWSTETCYKMYEPWKHYAKRKTLYDCIYIKYLE